MENEIINNYNKAMQEIKDEEKKKLADATDRVKAKSEVMKLDLSNKEIEDYVFKKLVDYIKE
ncbi:hypothetical protein [Acidiplasma cupricumulans]|nr:hypothetical protein [Acidiplasma cupricumulans]